MLSYKVLSRDVIEINLGNKYQVVAMLNWKRENNKYGVTLLLHEDSISKWELISENEFEIESDPKVIRQNVVKFIEELLIDNYFDKFISVYEYELKCFDLGNDVLERVKGS